MSNVLPDLLAAELSQVQLLLPILQQEQQALIQRQFDLVTKLIEAKLRALQALEQATAARSAYCQQQGWLSSDAIEAHLGEALPLWQELLLQARQADMLNRSNGQLIQSHEEVNRHLMASLAAARNPDIGYSADGRLSNQGAASRPLDRA
ncbi:flagella synthesis protein FlgN [Chitinibacter sp. ZOR0017]|uniref:flagella synthesis protein FlgN n=1 Tax=Chitinibacter sp. ZOR0017 TaxID=1339254 RepID=UPI0006476C22|nr:flagellar protein FlgN [Chitinibacter sp. ZOR0017]